MFNQLLPAAFIMLLLISSLTSSQSLLTSTIEEKSSRVSRSCCRQCLRWS